MASTIGELLDIIGSLAPWGLSQEWDNSGLQIGAAAQEVNNIVVSLDAGEKELSFAVGQKAQLLITHHPLIFNPLSRIDYATPAGALIIAAVREGVSVISAHTNLDVAPGGLADVLAETLHLENVRCLSPLDAQRYIKLVVFTPLTHVDLLMESLKEAGAGRIGRYTGCFFTSQGTGFFTPQEGAHPYIGTVNHHEAHEEARLETRVPRNRLKAVLRAVAETHPYDEPAIDIYPITTFDDSAGIGRIGERDISPSELVHEVKKSLSCDSIRVVGQPPERIRNIAVLPGSGGDFIQEARLAGADALITGEIKYHQALEATSTGPWIIEAGHRSTEYPAVKLIAEHVKRVSRERKLDLGVFEIPLEEDIYRTVHHQRHPGGTIDKTNKLFD